MRLFFALQSALGHLGGAFFGGHPRPSSGGEGGVVGCIPAPLTRSASSPSPAPSEGYGGFVGHRLPRVESGERLFRRAHARVGDAGPFLRYLPTIDARHEELPDLARRIQGDGIVGDGHPVDVSSPSKVQQDGGIAVPGLGQFGEAGVDLLVFHDSNIGQALACVKRKATGKISRYRTVGA